MELLGELIRARALEEVLSRIPAHGDPVRRRAVSPALPAARALRRASDGSGDVFSLRVGSPAAALGMGATPHEVLRQALGRDGAPARGRDPGGFPTDWDRGLLAPFHLPGILVEVMAGIALSFRLRGEARVALLVDDVAATGSGDWHEGLNFAAVREVPMVLVVDASRRRPTDSATESMADRAPAYGFAAHLVPGTDPRAVEGAVWAAAEAARTGGGLQVVEVTAPQDDPVEWLLRTQVASDALTAEDAAERVRQAEEEMLGALAEVEAEPEPDPSVALDSYSPSPAPWSAP